MEVLDEAELRQDQQNVDEVDGLSRFVSSTS